MSPITEVKLSEGDVPPLRIRFQRARPRFRMSLFLVLAFLGLLTASPALKADSTATRDEMWRQDLHYLAQTLPRVHKNAFFSVTREQFGEAVGKLDAAIPTLPDSRIVVEMARLVALIGDAHTAVNLYQTASSFRVLPLQITWFKDGLYVTATPAEYSAALGARVSQIGGSDIEKVVDAVSTVVSHENEAYLKQVVPQYMISPEILQGVGLIRETSVVIMRLQRPDGDDFELEIQPVERTAPLKWTSLPDPAKTALPLCFKNPRLYYWYEYIPDARTVYLQYNSCQNIQSKSFRQLTNEVLEVLKSNPVDRFVVDLRFNGGGDSRVAGPLLNALLHNPAINRKGHLFVIIGRRTFSSAILNALDFRNRTEATLVGEPTGGRPNHYGEVRTFALPNSKLVVSYSTKYFKQSREDTPSLMPDLTVELTSADYFAGRDPVIEAILAYPAQ